ncbi:hypothetical protein BDV93DRAFT_261528 [Ceratobasidium sp. AG-I]|nr:hypothetical protein BDV93DRAFT_261528 [Ceratobasidium sp. AG-I]
MASHTPGGQLEISRHRITNIRLEPSTSNYDIQLKILVDGQKAHRLPPIRHGVSLLWDRVIPCDVNPSSHVEIRVYEKHFFTVKRVGTLGYTVSAVAGQSDARFVRH